MSSTDIADPEAFDYGANAELFSSRSSAGRRQPLDYRRFTSAAEALRFVIEDLAPRFFVGAYLQVDESRYQGDEIRRLYASSHYPLPRRAVGDPIV
jgi:hypothetical protein